MCPDVSGHSSGKADAGFAFDGLAAGLHPAHDDIKRQRDLFGEPPLRRFPPDGLFLAGQRFARVTGQRQAVYRQVHLRGCNSLVQEAHGHAARRSRDVFRAVVHLTGQDAGAGGAPKKHLGRGQPADPWHVQIQHAPIGVKHRNPAKQVPCEKPLAPNAADARAMAQAAGLAGVITLVNLCYRNGAALQKAAAMVAEGMIGRIRHFEASYPQSWLTKPAWGDGSTDPQWLWRLSSAHGSKGVLGDVGIHMLDLDTFIAGERAVDVPARLATFDTAPGGWLGAYSLDANDSATMQIRLLGRRLERGPRHALCHRPYE